MTWAQRLKRVFNIDIEVCGRCGGSVKVIACIEDQDVIDTILAHLRDKEQGIPTLPHLAPTTRAPPGILPLFAGTEAGSTPLNQHGHLFMSAGVVIYRTGKSKCIELGGMFRTMPLTAASAGVFLHAGIKFPWFVFFQKDSGLRPKDAP